MTPRACFHAAAVTLLVGAVAPALAQTSATGSPAPRFDAQVLVTAERVETPQSSVPAATVVLGEETLQALPSVFLGETVSFIPGFQAMRGEFTAGRPVVSARGFFGGGEADYV